MQFRTNPQQKIVGAINGSAITLADVFPFHEFGSAHHAITEIANPLHVMVITQSAAAILDVRFLHENPASVLAMAFILIFQTPLQVVVDLPSDTALEKLPSELGMPPVIARQ